MLLRHMHVCSAELQVANWETDAPHCVLLHFSPGSAMGNNWCRSL